MLYAIVMDGEVQAKQRPKFNRKTGAVYTHKNTANFESTLKMLAELEVQKASGKPFDCPCYVSIGIFKKVPSSWSKKKREEYINGNYYVTVKPDLDNCAKSVLDALNGVFYTDDKLVCSLSVYKKYADHDFFGVTCTELDKTGEVKP